MTKKHWLPQRLFIHGNHSEDFILCESVDTGMSEDMILQIHYHIYGLLCGCK